MAATFTPRLCPPGGGIHSARQGRMLPPAGSILQQLFPKEGKAGRKEKLNVRLSLAAAFSFQQRLRIQALAY